MKNNLTNLYLLLVLGGLYLLQNTYCQCALAPLLLNFSNFLAPNHVLCVTDVPTLDSLFLSSIVFSSYVATKPIDLELTSIKSVRYHFKRFWLDKVIKAKLPASSKIAIQLRVKFKDGSTLSYSQISVVSIYDRNLLIDKLRDRLAHKAEQYSPL